MKRIVPQYLLLGAVLLCMSAPVRTDDSEDDPTEEAARVVSLEKVDQSLDTPAPASQFLVPDGEDLWKKARTRAYDVSTDHGGGFFNMSDLVGEGFKSAKKFQTERYAESASGSDLQYAIAADEANKDGTKVFLTRMRIVYFIGTAMAAKKADADTTRKNPDAEKQNTKKKEKPANANEAKSMAKPKHDHKKDEVAKKDDPAKKKGAAPAASMVPVGGQVVITAPEAVIDTVTNEGLAKGNVTVEVFEKAPDGSTGDRIAVMTSEWMRWRTWGEAAAGSTELALYTCSEKPGEPDPVVVGKYFMKQPDGTVTNLVVEGRGMVYETGTFDRPNEVADEDGRIAGLSTTSRNRAVFHSAIRMDTTANTIAAVMPFQNVEQPPAAPGAQPAKAAKTKTAPPPPPSRTVVWCDGPAEFDMAAVPRKKIAADETPQLILLARRFDFLNNVRMKKIILPDPNAKTPAPEEPPTEMACANMRIQYPPGSMPSPSTFPEYSEALGGVTMHGVDNGPPPVEGQPPPTPAPFNIACERLFFEGATDNLFLVGTAAKPAEFTHAQKGDGVAQQLCYRRLTQTLTMPSAGPKKMVIRPDATAAAAATAPKPPGTDPTPPPQGGFSFGNGDTIITWNGPLSRELRHLPVPGAPDRIKEVLLLRENVFIEQPAGGLKMKGEFIRVVRTMPEGTVEFIESIGGADASLGELQAKGEHLTVDMAYGTDGALTKNITTVIGSRARNIKATLYNQGSAIRSDKFIIDRVKNTFDSFGGAVAVVRNAQPDQPAQQPKPEAAEGAKGLIKDISFDPGAALFIQCDGEFSQDGTTNIVTIKKNVLIKQPGLQLLADEVYLKLQDPPPPGQPDPNAKLDANGKPVVAAKPDAPKPEATDPQKTTPPTPPTPNPTGTPASGLFSGDLETIDCRGMVELTTNDQLIQCDRLFKNVVEDKSLLEVNDPDNDVRVYLSEESGSSRVLSVKKSLALDGKTGTFQPGGIIYILPFRTNGPNPRDKDSSPARPKAVSVGPEAPSSTIPAEVKK